MVLNKRHVHQRQADAIGQGHAAPSLDDSVGREWENATTASGAQDHRFAADSPHLAGAQLDGGDTLYSSVIDEQSRDEPFIVAGDVVVLLRSLKQRVQHVKTGLVGGEPSPLDLHAAE